MRLLLPLLLLLTSSLQHASALKFLAYHPMFGRSHITFMGKVIDSLIDAGHEVTVLGPVLQSKLGSYGTKKAKTPEARVFEEEQHADMVSQIWISPNFLGLLRLMQKSRVVWHAGCNATIHSTEIIDQLRAEKFDAAFSQPLDLCGFGIFHHLGIKNVAITFSISAFENSFAITGNPAFPSYVPSQLGTTTDVMTFWERVMNFVPHFVIGHVMTWRVGATDAILREKYGQDFPSLGEILPQVSLAFLNSDPLIEFPRPITHNIIDIGGISVSGGHQTLNSTWDAIFSLRPKTVLLSFGTVAKSYLMPEAYKKTIRETFKKFPNVTFIWKYENPEDRISAGIDNIIESTFVPQNDMLYDPRLSLFITHCGQGSTTEATTAGVPLIVIPVMGDQRRNSMVIKRIGTGIVLNKEDLEESDELEKALKEILSNPEYAEKAAKIGQMIRDKPFSPKELLVKNMEFLATYGPLKQLSHHGRNLNFFQYYLIDVFAFLAFILLAVLSVIFFVLRAIFRCLSRSIKVKKE